MDEPVWRTPSTGRCFVYVLPCREEDTLKLGYARDPWVRVRAFHPRFHAFFDLSRGALMETDRVGEARAIEKILKKEFRSDAVIAPVVVRERAGGKFEWFRGIHSQLMDHLQSLGIDLGYPLHAPLSDWFRDQWLAQAERIVTWSTQEFEQIESWHFNADPTLLETRERAFRNLLDAWDCIGIPVDALLNDDVRRWYRLGFDD